MILLMHKNGIKFFDEIMLLLWKMGTLRCKKSNETACANDWSKVWPNDSADAWKREQNFRDNYATAVQNGNVSAWMRALMCE